MYHLITGCVFGLQIGRAEEMLYDHCYVSSDFMTDLRRWADADYYEDNVHKMQLPFTPLPKAQPVDPEILKQRRQELAKRLVEINAKKREEKVISVTSKNRQMSKKVAQKYFTRKIKDFDTCTKIA